MLPWICTKERSDYLQRCSLYIKSRLRAELHIKRYGNILVESPFKHQNWCSVFRNAEYLPWWRNGSFLWKEVVLLRCSHSNRYVNYSAVFEILKNLCHLIHLFTELFNLAHLKEMVWQALDDSSLKISLPLCGSRRRGPLQTDHWAG